MDSTNIISLRIPYELEFGVSIWVKEKNIVLSLRILGIIGRKLRKVLDALEGSD